MWVEVLIRMMEWRSVLVLAWSSVLDAVVEVVV